MVLVSRIEPPGLEMNYQKTVDNFDSENFYAVYLDYFNFLRITNGIPGYIGTVQLVLGMFFNNTTVQQQTTQKNHKKHNFATSKNVVIIEYFIL